MGSDQANKTYCTKDGNYWEHGTPKGQGHRTDLDGVVQSIKRGADAAEIANEHTLAFIKYHRGIKETIQILNIGQLKRDWKTEFIVYTGCTDSGKSRTARALEPTDSQYYKPHGKWWDGYSGQHTVIMDDFYGWIPYDELLRVADRYPHKVEIKGGFVEFTSRRLIITSNDRIEKWYNNSWYTEEKVKPLRRRLDIYEEFMILNGETVRTDLIVNNNIMDLLNFN